MFQHAGARLTGLPATCDAMVRAATLFLHLLIAPVISETIEVRDRGFVDLRTFECRDINRSTILQRVCYDRTKSHLIVAIQGAYDQYCDLPADTFDSLMRAPSMGQFFDRNIKGAGSGGRYDCPTRRRPTH